MMPCIFCYIMHIIGRPEGRLLPPHVRADAVEHIRNSRVDDTAVNRRAGSIGYNERGCIDQRIAKCITRAPDQRTVSRAARIPVNIIVGNINGTRAGTLYAVINPIITIGKDNIIIHGPG